MLVHFLFPDALYSDIIVLEQSTFMILLTIMVVNTYLIFIKVLYITHKKYAFFLSNYLIVLLFTIDFL